MGEIESASLPEILAIDFNVLFRNIFPDLSYVNIDNTMGITKRMIAIANIIYNEYGFEKLGFLASHESDTVRGWGAYLIFQNPQLILSEQLDLTKAFADDRHFGVREWAWLALRPTIIQNPQGAIKLLIPWTADSSANVRRFAVESLRPRGVWSAHISELKNNPQLAIDLLNPLKTDLSRYVQDSVANWLNDVYKTQPKWVEDLCLSWETQSNCPQSAYIIKRALRNKK